MLLNEFLKEHRTVQELKAIVAKQEANAVHQQKQIDAPYCWPTEGERSA